MHFDNLAWPVISLEFNLSVELMVQKTFFDKRTSHNLKPNMNTSFLNIFLLKCILGTSYLLESDHLHIFLDHCYLNGNLE